MADEKRNITIAINGKEVENTIGSINRQYRAQLKELKGLQVGTDKYKAKVAEIRQTKGILDKHRADIRGVSNEYGRAGKSAGMFSKLASGGLKTMAMSIIGPLASITAIVSIFTRGVKTIRDFNTSLSKLQAISKASTEEMRMLEQMAKQMGASTTFSASESADAMTFMAMAGWNTQQIMSGLPGVLSLAAAAGGDLAQVSDIVTDALTAFGLKAEDSAKFADLLASASSAANTNVTMMGDTFRYVAPIFGAFGMSAEDAALATGLMANAGIKATQAGTVLRGALSRMAKPTSEVASTMQALGLNVSDADGNFLPFIDTMDQLRSSFGELTPAQQAHSAAALFGQEAMSGMLAIINASEEEYNKLTDATRNYEGAAEEMAKIMNDNLAGSVKRFNSVLESMTLQFSEADGVLKRFVDFGSDYLTKLVAEIGALKGQFSELWGSLSSLVSNFLSAIGVSEDFGKGIDWIGLMIKKATLPLRVLLAIIFSLSEAFQFVASQIKYYALSILNVVKDMAQSAIDVLNKIPGVNIEMDFTVKEELPDPRSFKDTWDKISTQFTDIFKLEAPVEIGVPEASDLDNLNKVRDAIEAIEQRLKFLKEAQAGVEQGSEEWERYQLQIVKAEKELEKLKKSSDEMLGKKGGDGQVTPTGDPKEAEKQREKEQQALREYYAELAKDHAEFLEAKEALENEYIESQLTAEERELNAVTEKYFNILEAAKQHNEDTVLLEEALQAQLDEIKGRYREKEMADQKKAEEQLTQDRISFQQDMSALALGTVADLAKNAVAEQSRRQLDALNVQREQGILSEEEYQKQREEVQRRAFQRQKLADTATALINGALAVTKATAQTGVLSPFVIPGIVASTAAQVATIQAQKYKHGGVYLQGPSHSKGGMPVIDPSTGRVRAEMEGGEYITAKKYVTPTTIPLLNAINSGQTPQVNFGRYRKWKYESGGLFDLQGNRLPDEKATPKNNSEVAEKLDQLIGEMRSWQRDFKVSLSTNELRDYETRKNEVEKIANVRA